MFMSKENNFKCDITPGLKQIKIPVDGQLSKKGTIIKDLDAVREIDYSISEIVERINNAGFRSVFSCSGLKKDHPYKDVNRDGAYIGFLYQDNDLKALTLIRRVADRLNLTVEQCILNNRLALVVRIDKDKAGNSLTDRIRMANEARTVYCSSFKQPQGAGTKDLEAIIKKSGGLIYDSDEKIETVWKKFGNMLINTRHQNVS